MTSLEKFIQSQVHISKQDLQFILSKFKERVVSKDKFVVKKGQVVVDYFFIESGGLRIYLDKDDKQITTWLAFENEFFTELSSLRSGQPCQFNIQAIETTRLWTIHHHQMEELYQQFIPWQQFGRLVWERAFLKVVGGILNYQTMTAEDRYRQLMEESDLLQKIPLKLLSSYLGITPTSLSRLRKKIK